MGRFQDCCAGTNMTLIKNVIKDRVGSTLGRKGCRADPTPREYPGASSLQGFVDNFGACVMPPLNQSFRGMAASMHETLPF